MSIQMFWQGLLNISLFHMLCHNAKLYDFFENKIRSVLEVNTLLMLQDFLKSWIFQNHWVTIFLILFLLVTFGLIFLNIHTSFHKETVQLKKGPSRTCSQKSEDSHQKRIKFAVKNCRDDDHLSSEHRINIFSEGITSSLTSEQSEDSFEDGNVSLDEITWADGIESEHGVSHFSELSSGNISSSLSLFDLKLGKCFLSPGQHPENESQTTHFSSEELFLLTKTNKKENSRFSPYPNILKTSEFTGAKEDLEATPCPPAHLLLTKGQVRLLEENIRNQITLKPKAAFKNEANFLRSSEVTGAKEDLEATPCPPAHLLLTKGQVRLLEENIRNQITLKPKAAFKNEANFLRSSEVTGAKEDLEATPCPPAHLLLTKGQVRLLEENIRNQITLKPKAAFKNEANFLRSSEVTEAKEDLEATPCPPAHLLLTKGQVRLLEENIRNQITLKPKAAFKNEANFLRSSEVTGAKEDLEATPCPPAHLLLTKGQVRLLEENIRNQITLKSKAAFKNEATNLCSRSQESLVQNQHSVGRVIADQAQDSFRGQNTDQNEGFCEAQATTQAQQVIQNPELVNRQPDTKASDFAQPQNLMNEAFSIGTEDSVQAPDMDRSQELIKAPYNVETKNAIKGLESEQQPELSLVANADELKTLCSLLETTNCKNKVSPKDPSKLTFGRHVPKHEMPSEVTSESRQKLVSSPQMTLNKKMEIQKGLQSAEDSYLQFSNKEDFTPGAPHRQKCSPITKAKKASISKIINITRCGPHKHLPPKTLKSQTTEFLICSGVLSYRFHKTLLEDASVEKKKGSGQECPGTILESFPFSKLVSLASEREGDIAKCMDKTHKMCLKHVTLKAKKPKTLNIAGCDITSHQQELRCYSKTKMKQSRPIEDIFLNAILSSLIVSLNMKLCDGIIVTNMVQKKRFNPEPQQQEQAAHEERAWHVHSIHEGIVTDGTKDVKHLVGGADPLVSQQFSFKVNEMKEPNLRKSELELKISATSKMLEVLPTAQELQQQTLATQSRLNSILSSSPFEKLQRTTESQREEKDRAKPLEMKGIMDYNIALKAEKPSLLYIPGGKELPLLLHSVKQESNVQEGKAKSQRKLTNSYTSLSSLSHVNLYSRTEVEKDKPRILKSCLLERKPQASSNVKRISFAEPANRESLCNALKSKCLLQKKEKPGENRVDVKDIMDLVGLSLKGKNSPFRQILHGKKPGWGNKKQEDMKKKDKSNLSVVQNKSWDSILPLPQVEWDLRRKKLYKQKVAQFRLLPLTLQELSEAHKEPTDGILTIIKRAKYMPQNNRMQTDSEEITPSERIFLMTKQSSRPQELEMNVEKKEKKTQEDKQVEIGEKSSISFPPFSEVEVRKKGEEALQTKTRSPFQQPKLQESLEIALEKCIFDAVSYSIKNTIGHMMQKEEDKQLQNIITLKKNKSVLQNIQLDIKQEEKVQKIKDKPTVDNTSICEPSPHLKLDTRMEIAHCIMEVIKCSLLGLLQQKSSDAVRKVRRESTEGTIRTSSQIAKEYMPEKEENKIKTLAEEDILHPKDKDLEENKTLSQGLLLTPKEDGEMDLPSNEKKKTARESKKQEQWDHDGKKQGEMDTQGKEDGKMDGETNEQGKMDPECQKQEKTDGKCKEQERVVPKNKKQEKTDVDDKKQGKGDQQAKEQGKMDLEEQEQKKAGGAGKEQGKVDPERTEQKKIDRKGEERERVDRERKEKRDEDQQQGKWDQEGENQGRLNRDRRKQGDVEEDKAHALEKRITQLKCIPGVETAISYSLKTKKLQMKIKEQKNQRQGSGEKTLVHPRKPCYFLSSVISQPGTIAEDDEEGRGEVEEEEEEGKEEGEERGRKEEEEEEKRREGGEKVGKGEEEDRGGRGGEGEGEKGGGEPGIIKSSVPHSVLQESLLLASTESTASHMSHRKQDLAQGEIRAQTLGTDGLMHRNGAVIEAQLSEPPHGLVIKLYNTQSKTRDSQGSIEGKVGQKQERTSHPNEILTETYPSVPSPRHHRFSPPEVKLPVPSDTGQHGHEGAHEGTGSHSVILNTSQQGPFEEAKIKVEREDTEGRPLPQNTGPRAEMPQTACLHRINTLPVNTEGHGKDKQEGKSEPEMVLRKTALPPSLPSSLNRDNGASEKEVTGGRIQLCLKPLNIQSASDSDKETCTKSSNKKEPMQPITQKEEKDGFTIDRKDKILPKCVDRKVRKLPFSHTRKAQVLPQKMKELRGEMQEEKNKLMTDLANKSIKLCSQLQVKKSSDAGTMKKKSKEKKVQEEENEPNIMLTKASTARPDLFLNVSTKIKKERKPVFTKSSFSTLNFQKSSDSEGGMYIKPDTGAILTNVQDKKQHMPQNQEEYKAQKEKSVTSPKSQETKVWEHQDEPGVVLTKATSLSPIPHLNLGKDTELGGEILRCSRSALQIMSNAEETIPTESTGSDSMKDIKTKSDLPQKEEMDAEKIDGRGMDITLNTKKFLPSCKLYRTELHLCIRHKGKEHEDGGKLQGVTALRKINVLK